MGKRLLILESADTAEELVACCRDIGIESVLLPEAEDVQGEAILAAAKAARVDGVWAATPKRWSETQRVAATLGLPHAPQVALEEVVARGYWVRDVAEAEAACRAQEVPVWVRTAGETGSDWCMRVDHAADSVLAFRRAQRKGGGEGAFVQPVVTGKTFRVLGYVLAGALSPVAVLRESYADGPFRVIASCTVGCDERVDPEVVQTAQNVCSKLKQGCGLIEVELVAEASDVTVVHVRAACGIDPVRRALVQSALGVDLLAESLRVAVGEAPSILPSGADADANATICWLTARPGVIEAVMGVDAAWRLEGVKSVVVNAAVGDTVRHLEDRESLDRLGYVIATGTTPDAALQTAEAACAMIEIASQAAMD